jgi:hypothetical protein
VKDLTEIAPEVGLLAGRSTLGSDGSVTEGSGYGFQVAKVSTGTYKATLIEPAHKVIASNITLGRAASTNMKFIVGPGSIVASTGVVNFHTCALSGGVTSDIDAAGYFFDIILAARKRTAY